MKYRIKFRFNGKKYSINAEEGQSYILGTFLPETKEPIAELTIRQGCAYAKNRDQQNDFVIKVGDTLKTEHSLVEFLELPNPENLNTDPTYFIEITELKKQRTSPLILGEINFTSTSHAKKDSKQKSFAWPIFALFLILFFSSIVYKTIESISSTTEDPAHSIDESLPQDLSTTTPSSTPLPIESPSPDPIVYDNFFSEIRNGNIEIVRKMIESSSVDADFTLENGTTPLMIASQSGQEIIVQYLIDHNVSVNTKDPDGNTALLLALMNNYYSIAKLLLKHGADPNLARDDGQTPLDVAKRLNQSQMITLIEEEQKKRR